MVSMATSNSRVKIRRFWTLLFVVSAFFLVSVPASPAQEGPTLDLIELSGLIGPSTADYLTGRLERSEEDEVHVAVVQLDTPGGLDISMRDIIKQILASDVPVVVWVAPRGARAASAGTFITYAAHLAYMSESTEIGAATPVNLADDDDTLRQKVVNDAVAFIRELAADRQRDAAWAEEAVREASSIGATEAADRGVVDGIASSLDELLMEIDGQTVTLGSGRAVTVESWDEDAGAPSVTIRFQDMNPLERLLHFVVDPEVAYLLLLLGVFGLIFELYNPGIGLAGLLGAVALLLALYALTVLPTNWLGVGLIAIAVAFFLVDLQTAGLGGFSIGGGVLLVAGGMLLFSGANAELRLGAGAIALSVAVTAIFFMSVMTAALRVRLRRPVTGEDALVGMVGEAKTDIAPEGTVLTKGALWRARTMETGIAEGSKVKVRASEGLVLLVEPVHDDDAERQPADSGAPVTNGPES